MILTRDQSRYGIHDRTDDQPRKVPIKTRREWSLDGADERLITLSSVGAYDPRDGAGEWGADVILPSFTLYFSYPKRSDVRFCVSHFIHNDLRRLSVSGSGVTIGLYSRNHRSSIFFFVSFSCNSNPASSISTESVFFWLSIVSSCVRDGRLFLMLKSGPCDSRRIRLQLCSYMSKSVGPRGHDVSSSSIDEMEIFPFFIANMYAPLLNQNIPYCPNRSPWTIKTV